MQTDCPSCGNRLVLDDAKVPDTPFMLKCPKCQNTLKLPGKASAPAPAAPAAPEPTPEPAAVEPEPEPAPSPSPSPAAAPAPSGSPGSVRSGAALLALKPEGDDALVSLADVSHAEAIGAVLARLGYTVSALAEDEEQNLLKLQTGEFAILVASRAAASEESDLYAISRRLPSAIRRRAFLILVGDEFKSGEGTQAFSLTADLVLHPNELARCDRLIAQTVLERRRLYQTYWGAEDRKAEGKL